MRTENDNSFSNNLEVNADDGRYLELGRTAKDSEELLDERSD